MMSNFKETYDLRMALDEALRENDILAHQVNVLENETHADQICGYWRLSDQQTVHIRKDGSNTYTLSRWIKGFRAEVMSLRRTNGRLLLIDAEDGVRGGVYYFPESDSMLIEAIGLCTSIEKCTEEGA